MVKDYDLKAIIPSLQKIVSFKIEFKWVKSHQIDNNKEAETELDKEQLQTAIINRELDELATRQYNQPYLMTRPHF